MLFKHCCSLYQPFQGTLHSQSSQWSKGFDCFKLLRSLPVIHTSAAFLIEIFSSSLSADKKSFHFFSSLWLCCLLLFKKSYTSGQMRELEWPIFCSKNVFYIIPPLSFIFIIPFSFISSFSFPVRSWQMPSLVWSSTSSVNWRTTSPLRTLGGKCWQVSSWQQVIYFFHKLLL